MLEEGELDDDLDIIQPAATNNDQEVSPKNETKVNKTKKTSLLPTPPTFDAIPSLLSTNFDDLSEKKIQNSLNKRKKLHEKNDKVNKKKLKKPHHHHHHQHHHDLNQDEDLSDAESIEPQDKDERSLFDASANYFKPIAAPTVVKAPLLATPQWTQPVNGSTVAKTQAPVSLLDLIKNTNAPSLLGNGPGDPSFINPIITEKENNKPIKIIRNEDDEDESEMVSVDTIKEKHEKKRKYMEIHKDMKRKEADKAQQLKEKAQQIKEKVLCHFFVEGRCQKGDKCTFSHNIQLNPKKYEICKFYLNGFCSKGDKCLFMHSEFPCKFFHRVNFRTGQKKNECANGDTCRFSHAPITNPLLKEAFEKYLNESNPEATINPIQISIANGILNNSNRLSILGSPPAALLNKESKEVPTQPIPTVGESIPSLMNMSVKPAILPTPSHTLIHNDLRTYSPPSSPPTQFKDVDERVPLLPTLSSTKIIKDIDERPAPLLPLPLPLPIPQPKPQVTSIDTDANYETIKKELIIKVMKAIADEDENIFSQIPKHTLTELLVKLLNTSSTSNENRLSTNSIETLLTTLTPSKPHKIVSHDEHLNESSSSLQIDFSSKRKRIGYDDEAEEDDEDDDEIRKININESSGVIEEEDDYDYDNDLVIEGNIGEIPYRLYEIDIEPSELWTRPPVNQNELSFNPATLLSQLSSSSSIDNCDQECDPRIKYYSNKANATNVSNFQQMLILQQQQQQQQAPLSPTAVTNTPPSSLQEPTSNNIKTTKPTRADPRLVNRNNLNSNNLSPTRSITPPLPTVPQTIESKNDLISIQNRQLSANSLLSSLPDFQFPKDNSQAKTLQAQSIITQNTNNSESSTVKLSIADYKRKTQKPILTMSNNTSTSQLIMNSLLSNNNSSVLNTTTTTTTINNSNNSNTSSLPSIPSYSVNLQAPQSLHELFRNFQS